MERRYKHLAGWGVRNIDGYNAEVKKRNAAGQFDEEGEAAKPLPYIVIIIDELADLMMASGKEVESSITRLAQMARAVGIHLVLATQRPSVDVITGLIKANFPARISFRVSSKIDSRTIIDGNGAESLLGRGDMLFLPPATSQIVRVHGAYVDEKEIQKIVRTYQIAGKSRIRRNDYEIRRRNGRIGRSSGQKRSAFCRCSAMRRQRKTCLNFAFATPFTHRLRTRRRNSRCARCRRLHRRNGRQQTRPPDFAKSLRSLTGSRRRQRNLKVKKREI